MFFCTFFTQISCNAGSSGYSNTTTATTTGINYNATGAAAANNTSAATTGFASVLTPLDFNAPLLVIFNKTRYPEYNQQCLCLQQQATYHKSRSDNGSGASVSCSESNTIKSTNEQRSNVFQTQRSFLQWEGAVELHAACLDQVMCTVYFFYLVFVLLRDLAPHFISGHSRTIAQQPRPRKVADSDRILPIGYILECITAY